MVNKVPHQLPNLIDPIPLPPHTIIESINDAYHQAVCSALNVVTI